MNYRELYNTALENRINDVQSEKSIVVFQGDTSLVDIQKFESLLLDPETFASNQGKEVFTDQWFQDTLAPVFSANAPILVSLAQLTYLTSNRLDLGAIESRIILIKDNFRRLFPLPTSDYLETVGAENLQERPQGLPLHQAEQYVFDGKYYFCFKPLIGDLKKHDLFTDTSEISHSDSSDVEAINLVVDDNALDLQLNSMIQTGDFSSPIVVRKFKKHPYASDLLKNLEKVNAVLSMLGGELNYAHGETVQESYTVSHTSEELLKKYWGNGAAFRSLSIYKEPDISNNVIEISQGKIVDTIIQEFKNAQTQDKPVRDLFLTAPTGAGKSLLFQLPAFYVSEQKKVTIVVSPLIALMRDQVNAVREDRGFEKIAFLNSELSLHDRERVLDQCKTGEIDVLYMSPELLLSYSIEHFLGERELGLLVIDEAHLITTWGRDFRVDYWFLGNHIQKIRKFHNMRFPMVAVTATAIYGGADDMVNDSTDSLVMRDPHVFVGEVKRKNIDFLISNYEEPAKKLRKIQTEIKQLILFTTYTSSVIRRLFMCLTPSM
jgi:ATP-dependent DNA helicase RecQ